MIALRVQRIFIKRMIDIRLFTTFRVPAPVSGVYSVANESELWVVARESRRRRRPIFLLGGGSNVLFTKPFRGDVIRIDIPGFARDEGTDFVEYTVGAGEEWDSVVEKAAKSGLWGIECLAGIPGRAGAAPVQNIGAYGAELKDVLVTVETMDLETGEIKSRPAGELQLGYRDSLFKRDLKGKEAILRITLRLSRQKPPANKHARLGLTPAELDGMDAQMIREHVLRVRAAKLPAEEEAGSAGSFFKNPEVEVDVAQQLKSAYPDLPSYPGEHGGVKLSAGWLIDRAGWKGIRQGDAGVWPQQALVLVNYGEAKGSEIQQLACDIVESVEHQFGVHLTPEVNIL